jgi:hypothetical protein
MASARNLSLAIVSIRLRSLAVRGSRFDADRPPNKEFFLDADSRQLDLAWTPRLIEEWF